MVRFKPGKCEYCGTDFVPINRDQRRLGRIAARSETCDHIYPKNRFQTPRKYQTHDLINLARVCCKCNNRKGAMHPLSWLVEIERDHCAAAFAVRLTALGENVEAIKQAFTRRTERLST